nr:hypothetical protein Iba_chr06aCG3600 [Ipomoea batatas]
MQQVNSSDNDSIKVVDTRHTAIGSEAKSGNAEYSVQARSTSLQAIAFLTSESLPTGFMCRARRLSSRRSAPVFSPSAVRPVNTEHQTPHASRPLARHLPLSSAFSLSPLPQEEPTVLRPVSCFLAIRVVQLLDHQRLDCANGHRPGSEGRIGPGKEDRLEDDAWYDPYRYPVNNFSAESSSILVECAAEFESWMFIDSLFLPVRQRNEHQLFKPHQVKTVSTSSGLKALDAIKSKSKRP